MVLRACGCVRRGRRMCVEVRKMVGVWLSGVVIVVDRWRLC